MNTQWWTEHFSATSLSSFCNHPTPGWITTKENVTLWCMNVLLCLTLWYSRDKPWLSASTEQSRTNISWSHHEFESRQATNEKRCGGLTAPVNFQWAHIKSASFKWSAYEQMVSASLLTWDPVCKYSPCTLERLSDFTGHQCWCTTHTKNLQGQA